MEKLLHLLGSLDFATDTPTKPTASQVFNSFKQGTVDLPLHRRIFGGGNCASIALIKAAIATFGFEKIFRSITIDHKNERFLIDLQDDENRVYTLSFKDYMYCSSKSAFEIKAADKTSENILEYANFCFAVMATLKVESYRTFRSYKRAVNDLNQSESTAYIHTYLGLTVQPLQNLDFVSLESCEHVIVWNQVHAVYSNKGKYDEAFPNNYNDVPPLDQLQHLHGDGSDSYKPVGAHQLIFNLNA